jgi:hypothetical protein
MHRLIVTAYGNYAQVTTATLSKSNQTAKMMPLVQWGRCGVPGQAMLIGTPRGITCTVETGSGT